MTGESGREGKMWKIPKKKAQELNFLNGEEKRVYSKKVKTLSEGENKTCLRKLEKQKREK